MIKEFKSGICVDLGVKVENTKYETTDDISFTREFRDIYVESKDFMTLCHNRYSHGLVSACHIAFADHVPLEISPDDIWLMICQGISIHEQKTGILGKVFNLPKEKKKIIVDAPDFVKGSPKNDWLSVFDVFDEQIKENIPESLYTLIANKKYTTTTKLSHACFSICLMDSLKNYFSYSVRTKCGIPKIFVTGAESDWKKIKASISSLSKAKIGLDFWWPLLTDIVQNFIDLYSGKCDKTFWSSLYKYRGHQGSGWICAFFPYTKVGGLEHPKWVETVSSGKVERWLDLFDEVERDGWFGKIKIGILKCEGIPSGVNSVEFIWDYMDKKFEMMFYGGFLGTEQDPKSLAVRSRMGWAVADKNQNYE